MKLIGNVVRLVIAAVESRSGLRYLVGFSILCLLAAPARGATATDTSEVKAATPLESEQDKLPLRTELQELTGVRGWRINGEELPIEQVREQAFLSHSIYILRDLVSELLLNQEAKRRGITITEADVEQKIREIREDMGITADAALASYLDMKRVTPYWFRDKARAYALMEKVLSDQIYISDKEIERTYERYRDIYRRRETVAFRAMALPDQKTAQAALEEIRKGRSFEEVAKSQTSDPREKTYAGQLNFYEKGQTPGLSPDLEAALFTAPLDQVTGPIKTKDPIRNQDIYILLRVERKTDPHQFTLDEVREVIRGQLRKQKLDQVVWPKWIQAQLSNAQIEVLKVETTSSPKPGGKATGK